MQEKTFLKLISSIPIILLVLYFAPFLGVCLIFFRFFMYRNLKKKSISLTMVILGFTLLIPKVVYEILKATKVDIPAFNDFVTSSLYNVNFIKYSKFLITAGIFFIIISYVSKILFAKASSSIRNGLNSYIQKEEQINREISEKNDMIMKEKQEKAKNTHVVYCPSCGGDNMITGTVGTCKFCRKKIVYKG